MQPAHTGVSSLDSFSEFPAHENNAVCNLIPAINGSAHDSEINYAESSEAQLLAAATSDQNAFAELSGRYVSAVYRRVFTMVRNREDAEDVIQDTLLNAYRHLPAFRGSCRFSIVEYSSSEMTSSKAAKHQAEARFSIFIKAQFQACCSNLRWEEGGNRCALMSAPSLRAKIEPARLMPEREPRMG